ncbi:MAG: ABC transporter ATP-binding protein [Gemmatimonadaceae bacterium]
MNDTRTDARGARATAANVVLRLLRYAAPFRTKLARVFVLALVGAAFELARPWPIKVVVDYALAGRPLPPWLAAVAGHLPGGAGARGLIAWSVVAALLTVVAAAAAGVWVRTVTMAVGQRMVLDLSRDVFARLQRLSLAFHGRHTVGDLMQRVGSDVFVIQAAVAGVVLPAVISLLTLVGMFVVLARLDVMLAWVAIAVVPLLGVVLAVYAKPMNAASAQQWKSQGALMAFVEQSLSAVRVIQGFAREKYVEEKLQDRARVLGDAYTRSTYVGTAYNQLTAVVTGGAAALLLGLGASRVLAGRLTLGDLLVFLSYLAALYGPVNTLSIAVGAAIAAAARARRVFDVLDAREEVPEASHPASLGRARGEVAFQSVTFGYAEAGTGGEPRPVLRRISFRASPGQITAIVGATGAGKSSLVALLSRLYDPWEGTVRVDGHDIRDLSLRSLRENVSLVLQDPYLFPISVADNIAFGRPGATRAEIVEAATVAHAHSFIERLPEGYDTVIGERGATLSGGERQRISIARAVLKDAPIIVFDEPTSALDAHTESLIFEALSGLMRDRTTFVISHRLSTIRRADQILALDEGRIVERGTHEALLERESVYARLYRHQHVAAL